MENEIRLLRYYLDLIRRRALVWIIPLVLVLGVGLYMVMSMPRSYVAEALFIAKTQQMPDTLVQSTVTSERIQFFERRALAREGLLGLIKKFDLMPQLRGTVSDTELTNMVRKSITIKPVIIDPTDMTPESTVFSVSYEGKTPELAAAVTSEIVAMITNENRRGRMSQATEATRFLEREVATLTADLKALDDKWSAFVKANEAMLPSRLPIHTAAMQEKQKELQEVQTLSAQLAAETRLNEAQLALAVPLGNAAERGQKAELAQLNADLVTKLSVLSESHPDVKAMRSRIAALEAEIANTPPAAPAAPIDYESLGPEIGLLAERVALANQQQEAYTQRKNRLNSELAALRETITRMPAVETELANLQRQRDTAQANLTDMTTRLNTARVGERLESDQQESQIQLLEAPEVPKYPNGNGRSRMMTLVVGCAMAAALAMLLIVDQMDGTIKGANDFKRVLEGATLVVLPQWNVGPSGATRFLVSTAVVSGLAILSLAVVFFVLQAGPEMQILGFTVGR